VRFSSLVEAGFPHAESANARLAELKRREDVIEFDRTIDGSIRKNRVDNC